ncbi:MAG: response regulator transcription factor [Pseudonocardiaceae bacterium]
MIRVVVVDDQPLVRAGLRAMLDVEDGIEIVGEAADGRQALAVIRAQRPDVVLMDIRMPEVDGIAALREITRDPSLHAVRVLILTTFDLDSYVRDALGAGASGFLLKDADPDELLRAVRVVAAGDALVAPTVLERLIRSFVSRPAPSAAPDRELSVLTDRERQVLTLVARGLSNNEIAAALTMSQATARTHVSRAMTKLRARDRAQLVVIAYRCGLTDLDT